MMSGFSRASPRSPGSGEFKFVRATALGVATLALASCGLVALLGHSPPTGVLPPGAESALASALASVGGAGARGENGGKTVALSKEVYQALLESLKANCRGTLGI